MDDQISKKCLSCVIGCEKTLFVENLVTRLEITQPKEQQSLTAVL